MAIKIFDFWKRNRPELDDALNFGENLADTTAATIGLAIALGVANPALGAAALILPFTGTARRGIDYVVNKTNKKLTLEEVVAIAAPLAYVESFASLIESNKLLKKKLSQEQNAIAAVDSTIENLELDRELATNALRCFHKSALGKTFNTILYSQLIKPKLSKIEAGITVVWVAWVADSILKAIIEEYDSSDSVIIGIHKNVNSEEDSAPFQSIEKYLTEQISKNPHEKVFDEEFSFAQIYVPLDAKHVDENGEVEENSQSIVIEDWAKEMLLNPKNGKQLMFIQAGPGRGKSVFCRMFADWVRENIHPFYIPVLIRLRDIDTFEANFEKTLQGAVKADFARDKGWLTDSKCRFLFLLDGFDELRMEGRAGGGIERFIKQVGSFQERCDTSEMGHRFIVTGRQLALQGISYLPNNLARVELSAMDDLLQQEWLEKWQELVDKDSGVAQQKTQDFQEFLQSENLPEEIKKDLAREPLLLYLLAAMHRDREIQVEDLEGTSGIQAKISIYDKALDWVLNKQRKPVQKEIVKLEPDELLQVLMEAGLSVVQSGGECARVQMIRERLNKSEPEIAEKIYRIQKQDKDEVLKNALAAFYLKQAAGDEGGSVEFFHKSFGEFLCAKRMQKVMEDWTEPRRRGRGFYVNDDQLAEQIYDLFGYGGLTPEILQYLWGLLCNSEEFRPVELFNRLDDFYECWSEGEFIDADGTTLPQEKMRKLRALKPKFNQETDILGQRQVDVHTGLNIVLILLQLHRYARQKEDLKNKINFHLCGAENSECKLKDARRLFKIIGYCRCVSDFGFLNIAGNFLSYANLSDADLSDANFRGADLSNANLSDANLSDADLSDANFRGADLSNANLRGADLIEANLRNAYLIKANLRNAYLRNANLRNAYLRNAYLRNAYLSSVYLSYADLSYADLSYVDLSYADLSSANLSSANLNYANLSSANLNYANLSSADLEGITWNESTIWLNVKGLLLATNVPDALKEQL